MRKNLIFILLTLLITITATGVTNQAPKTIPFIIYEEKPVPTQMTLSVEQPQPITYISKVTARVDYHPTQEVISFLKDLKTTVCQSVGEADVKVWVSTDLSGKVLGIGAAAQSGIEVTFHCKEGESQKGDNV